jgi:hypothetical protein
VLAALVASLRAENATDSLGLWTLGVWDSAATSDLLASPEVEVLLIRSTAAENDDIGFTGTLLAAYGVGAGFGGKNF